MKTNLTTRVLLLLATLVIPLGTLPIANGATRTVATLNDTGAGSLRQTIMDAMSGDTINFSVTGTISLTSGELGLCKSLTLAGPGVASLTLSGNNSNRVFSVCTNVTVNIMDLTIANGYSTNGGGIYNDGGTVKLAGVNLLRNQAVVIPDPNLAPPAPHGGAIYNLGSITATNCLFSMNSAVISGATQGGIALTAGGAVYNLGSIQASTCAFVDNRATGGSWWWSKSGGAAGGAIYSASNATCWILNGTFEGNSAEGASSSGGGSGGDGSGGGICSAGPTVLSNVTFAANQAGGGSGGNYPNGPVDGGQAMGGALFCAGPTVLCNVTLATNQAIGGTGGGFYGTGAGGNASGGALYSDCTTALTNCSFSGNGVTGGGGGQGMYPPYQGPNGTGQGGGAYSTTNATLLKNTIVAYSLSGSNIWGTITDTGNNLSSDPTGGFTAGSSHVNTDPLLGPLGYYGGPTPTLPLLYGSPAIDAGDATAAPATDQRGFPRPFGSAADIGAYEWGAAPPMQPQFTACRRSTNAIELAVSGEIGRLFELHSSSNLTEWAWLANLTNTTGSMLYTDTGATNQPRRFYKAIQLP